MQLKCQITNYHIYFILLTIIHSKYLKPCAIGRKNQNDKLRSTCSKCFTLKSLFSKTEFERKAFNFKI